MKSILSIALLLAAFAFSSCNQSFKGKTYYLLYISPQPFVCEKEIHFLSDEMVEIKPTVFASSNGSTLNYPIFKYDQQRLYHYWVNDNIISIPDYNDLKITITEQGDLIGITTALPLFDSGGSVYPSSIMNHLNDNIGKQRIHNVVPSDEDVLYLLHLLKPKKERSIPVVTKDTVDYGTESCEEEIPVEKEVSPLPEPTSKSFTHTFPDRTIITKPSPDAEFKEGGEVVIRTTVDREGQVIAKRIKSAASPELGKIAMRKVDEVRFSKSEIAPLEQFGDITFVFKTRTNK